MSTLQPSENLQGVTVKEYAIIATNSIVLPGKVIGEHSLVGAGSIVTKDVPEMACCVGNPAKKVCNTTEIKDKETGEIAYPWPKHFDRGMPWSGMDYETWLNNVMKK